MANRISNDGHCEIDGVERPRREVKALSQLVADREHEARGAVRSRGGGHGRADGHRESEIRKGPEEPLGEEVAHASGALDGADDRRRPHADGREPGKDPNVSRTAKVSEAPRREGKTREDGRPGR